MIKELLKENIKELKNNTCLNVSKIEFKGDEFIVLDKDKNVIFIDLIKNYGITFDSQKRFMLNVADKVTSFLEVIENVKEFTFNDLIKVDNIYYFDVIGKSDIYKDDTFIWINKIKLYREYKKIYIKSELDYYIKEIKNMFKDKGVRVVAYYDNYYKVGFYVSAEMYKDKVLVNYIKNSKITFDVMTLYYSSIEDEKEADKVIEFIIELIKN